MVEWMVKNWGLQMLKSGTGVIDVGGDPGFVAVALMKRGIPVTVVDPTWGVTGKGDWQTQSELTETLDGQVCWNRIFRFFSENFDAGFCVRNAEFVDAASVIVSLYGDEATSPSVQMAAALGKPCFVVPCNECIRFYPPQNQTYDAYVQACVDEGNRMGGRFEQVQLQGVPFSRSLVAQWPAPEWAAAVPNGIVYRRPPGPPLPSPAENQGVLSVPIGVLKDMGLLNEVIWKVEMARMTGAPQQMGQLQQPFQQPY